jgi:ribose/xylose/arabinose/galactoside ABC-type transport system permease subunit
MATSAVIAIGFAATDNRMVPLIIATAIVLGVVVGLVNGFLVARRNVSPFLATLATTIVLQGLRFLYTQGSTGSTLPSAFALIGAGRWLGVPVNLIALLVLAAILGFVLLVSKVGRKVYLVGGNVRGAMLVGLSTDWIIIGCYVLCSVISAIAGLFLVGYVGQVDQWTGKGYELDSIVAAVMGGVAITGGRGNGTPWRSYLDRHVQRCDRARTSRAGAADPKGRDRDRRFRTLPIGKRGAGLTGRWRRATRQSKGTTWQGRSPFSGRAPTAPRLART